ncbi:hypothetical protein IAG44_40940 [Streptomyces roseirectus]|uniref:Uncharacterized protein n=1 Tax=Streptomyces roseirectus TaxID=2768066 RepID=A0A7H0IQT4_9ACTN|nr:hypothetical protein [Streptomyces roseirectus]QNP75150.1 hypothetical protein IAG44_40940 [Streptomyces roseirectus]
MRYWHLGVAASLLVLPLSGCGQEQRGPVMSTPTAQFHDHIGEREREEGRAGQRALLADGSASRGDYEAAVSRLRTCLARGGVALVNHGWNPVNHQRMSLWYKGSSLSDDEAAAYGDQCHAAHVADVELRYVEQHPPRMSAALLASTRPCLSAGGIATTGDEESLPELVRAVGPDRKRDVFECVSKGISKRYPDKLFVVS